MVWRSKCLDPKWQLFGFFLKGESVLIACFGSLDVAVQVRTVLLPLITARALLFNWGTYQDKKGPDDIIVFATKYWGCKFCHFSIERDTSIRGL